MSAFLVSWFTLKDNYDPDSKASVIVKKMWDYKQRFIK